MHYVIGDVHGHYNAFMRLLGKLNLTAEDKVILIGDIVDRAPSYQEHKSMIDWALTNITEDGQFQMVLGNHEYDLLMKIHEANEAGDKYKVKYNGLFETHYGFMKFANETGVDVDRLGELLDSLPLYKNLTVDNKTVLITHSWLCDDSGCDCIEDTSDMNALVNGFKCIDTNISVWDRNYSVGRVLWNVTVIHGHTPIVEPDHFDVPIDLGKVLHIGRNINVDCGCYFGPVRDGNLAAYCIESGESIYAYSEEDIAAMIANTFKGDFKFASLIVKAYTGKVLELTDLYTDNRDYDILAASKDVMASFAIMSDFARYDLEYKDLLSEKSDKSKEIFSC